jgi:hypothetical protein
MASYRQEDSSRFRIDPDPPIEGKPLQITYVGPATEIEIQVDNNPPTKVKPDKNGKYLLNPMPTGHELMLSDRLGLPGYLYRKIIKLG